MAVNLPLNVIVLDDDIEHSVLVVSALNESPHLYQAIVCPRPENAIHSIQNVGTYHLIFMGFPEDNERAKELLSIANFRKIPVIVFIPSHQLCVDWLERGAFMVLPKPLEHKCLILPSWQYCIQQQVAVGPVVEQPQVGPMVEPPQPRRRAPPFKWTDEHVAAFNNAIATLSLEAKDVNPTNILHIMEANGVQPLRLSVVQSRLKSHRRHQRVQEQEE